MEEAHVEGGLGAVLEARVAERLRAETVQPADLARVVAEQIDVVAIIRFVGGAGQHRQGRQLFCGHHVDEALAIPGREGLFNHHLVSLQVLATGQVASRQRLDDRRQMNLRVDAQRVEESLLQIVPGLGWQLQAVGTWRVLGEVLPGELLLFIEQLRHCVILLGEELLQRFDCHQRRVAQGWQLLQRQVAAHCVIGPAPG